MPIKIITRNKRATYDYLLLEKFEAGVVFQGTEIKSLREGKVSINESFIVIDGDKLEAYIVNMLISQYEFGNRANHKEDRKRKLLLHKREIKKIFQMTKAQGASVIPLAVYFKDALVKVELAVAKGKKLYDKRQDNLEKDDKRNMQRELQKERMRR
ncbi:MAG: SsrA-binding protein SmpB [Oligoflexia bacterium]|nr:SsrA-binding protein SmpB [Oligoflexia bacterium]